METKMKTRIEIATATNGATAEVATVVHEGREFTALGACVDLENGIISAYVGASLAQDDNGVKYLPGHLFRLSSFAGEAIGTVRMTTKSRRIHTAHGFHHFEYYTMQFQGYSWHGKKTDAWQLIRLRRGKALPVR
jgi:hypothetical protein